MNMKWTIASYQVSSWLNLSIYLQQLLGSQIRVWVTKITEKIWFSEIIWSWTTYPWYLQGCWLSISHCILMRSETLPVLSVTIQASSPLGELQAKNLHCMILWSGMGSETEFNLSFFIGWMLTMFPWCQVSECCEITLFIVEMTSRFFTADFVCSWMPCS